MRIITDLQYTVIDNMFREVREQHILTVTIYFCEKIFGYWGRTDAVRAMVKLSSVFQLFNRYLATCGLGHKLFKAFFFWPLSLSMCCGLELLDWEVYACVKWMWKTQMCLFTGGPFHTIPCVQRNTVHGKRSIKGNRKFITHASCGLFGYWRGMIVELSLLSCLAWKCTVSWDLFFMFLWTKINFFCMIGQFPRSTHIHFHRSWTNICPLQMERLSNYSCQKNLFCGLDEICHPASWWCIFAGGLSLSFNKLQNKNASNIKNHSNQQCVIFYKVIFLSCGCTMRARER